MDTNYKKLQVVNLLGVGANYKSLYMENIGLEGFTPIMDATQSVTELAPTYGVKYNHAIASLVKLGYFANHINENLIVDKPLIDYAVHTYLLKLGYCEDHCNVVMDMDLEGSMVIEKSLYKNHNAHYLMLKVMDTDYLNYVFSTKNLVSDYFYNVKEYLNFQDAYIELYKYITTKLNFNFKVVEFNKIDKDNPSSVVLRISMEVMKLINKHE